MTPNRKAKPDDVRKVSDEKVDAVERSSAIARLRFDGIHEIEPVLARLFRHPSFLLRRDAVVTLVGFWHKAQHFDEAVRMLHTDADETVRGGAAFALAQFVKETKTNQERVVSALFKQLREETQPSVQEECYKSLLRLLAPNRVPPSAASVFNRERDVNWNLLR